MSCISGADAGTLSPCSSARAHSRVRPVAAIFGNSYRLTSSQPSSGPTDEGSLEDDALLCVTVTVKELES